MSVTLIVQEAIRHKMVFCDIDGTLIDSENRISTGTKQKIQELHRRGIPFILVSARMPSGILPLQRELEITAPVICYSGALILDEHGECMQSTGISRGQAALVESFLRESWGQVCCGAYCHNSWLVEDVQNAWVVQEQAITTSVPTQGHASDASPPDAPIHKFLCMGQAEHITALNRALKERFPALSVHRSKATYLEVMDGAASKSGAVAVLCRAYGIPLEATVSFGDGYNDVDMLRATGTSFAMENAPEEVKRQARFVTLDNNREGVLAGLKQLNFAN